MILLTGATGLTGSHLLYFLLEKGKKVRALYRSVEKKERVKNIFSLFTDQVEYYFNQIDWVMADLTDIPALTLAFKDIEEVYHTAAYVSFNPKDQHQLQKSTVEGTANVVNLSLSEGVKKFCHISSIATLSKLPHQPITEENYWNPDEENNLYSLAKYAAEMEVWRGMEEGLQVVIVNPGLILGSGFWDSGTSLIIQKIARGVSFFPTGKIGWIDVIDVAEICILLMDKNHFGHRYILVSENQSYRDFMNQVALFLNQSPPTRPLHSWQLHILRMGDKLRSWVTGKPRQLFASTVRSMSKQQEYSNQKLIEKTNYSFIPWEQTLHRICRDFNASLRD